MEDKGCPCLLPLGLGLWLLPGLLSLMGAAFFLDVKAQLGRRSKGDFYSDESMVTFPTARLVLMPLKRLFFTRGGFPL